MWCSLVLLQLLMVHIFQAAVGVHDLGTHVNGLLQCLRPHLVPLHPFCTLLLLAVNLLHRLSVEPGKEQR